MSQTSVIAAALIIAYVVFVTVNGEFPCYLEVLGLYPSGQGCAKITTVTGGPAGISISGPGGTVGVGVGPGGVTIGGGINTPIGRVGGQLPPFGG